MGSCERARWGEWGFGVIVFGGGKAVGTITRNEARGRTGCGDCARERTVTKVWRLMSGTLQVDGKSEKGAAGRSAGYQR